MKPKQPSPKRRSEKLKRRKNFTKRRLDLGDAGAFLTDGDRTKWENHRRLCFFLFPACLVVRGFCLNLLSKT